MFDCAFVLLALPLWAPIFILIGLAVRVTSPGPVLFFQKRIGRYGKIFRIIKFRTMVHGARVAPHPITTVDNQRFTSIGRFLRRWKLDELPQLLNVILGHMSLVGPRPKLPEHTVATLPCRPGITGAATVAFAHEEAELAQLPQGELTTIYHGVVLPAKHSLDVEYMASATLVSDLKMIVASIVRRRDVSLVRRLIQDRDRSPLKEEVDPSFSSAFNAKMHPDLGSGHRGIPTRISTEETASA